MLKKGYIMNILRCLKILVWFGITKFVIMVLEKGKVKDSKSKIHRTLPLYNIQYIVITFIIKKRHTYL